jgi:hypothetical protein
MEYKMMKQLGQKAVRTQTRLGRRSCAIPGRDWAAEIARSGIRMKGIVKGVA